MEQDEYKRILDELNDDKIILNIRISILSEELWQEYYDLENIEMTIQDHIKKYKNSN